VPSARPSRTPPRQERLLLLGEFSPSPVAIQGGTGRDLGAVQSHDPNPDHPGLLAHEQDLEKQRLDILKVLATKRGEVWKSGRLLAASHRKVTSSMTAWAILRLEGIPTQ